MAKIDLQGLPKLNNPYDEQKNKKANTKPIKNVKTLNFEKKIEKLIALYILKNSM